MLWWTQLWYIIVGTPEFFLHSYKGLSHRCLTLTLPLAPALTLSLTWTSSSLTGAPSAVMASR